MITRLRFWIKRFGAIRGHFAADFPRRCRVEAGRGLQKTQGEVKRAGQDPLFPFTIDPKDQKLKFTPMSAR